MTSRYNHWFWNSNFVMWISRNSSRFNSWLWGKQYSRNNIKEST
jgi:S-adenosylmethionine:diacylglycerol 3-amino-3-carboxypropyl transferase